MRIFLFSLLIVFLSAPAFAGELLPFPEQDRSPAPSPEQQALEGFRNKIRGLDCTSLNELRMGLRQRVNQAPSSFDRGYYQNRLNAVNNARAQNNCP